jgi:5'-nucleotidase
MLEKSLLQAIQSIEKMGNLFNETPEEVIQERLFEYDEYLPREALEPIKKYMVRKKIKVGNFNWDDYFFSFVDESDDEYFMLFSNAVEQLRINAMGSFPTYKDMPTELILLFRTLGTSFHLEEYQPNQKRLYIDMDNVVVDFPSAFANYSQEFLDAHPEKDEIEGIFSKMQPVAGAIDAVEKLYRYFDIYFLSTASFMNPSAWSGKVKWIQKHFPIVGYKRLILTHHKNLNKGDYLIDDRTRNGVLGFEGTHIHFKESSEETWQKITEYLIDKEANPIDNMKPHIDAQETAIIFLAGFGGGSHSNSYQSLKNLVKNCAFYLKEYDNEIPTKAYYSLAIEIKNVCDNFKHVILVGNSLGGYYANYFAEKFNLPCVLINPSLYPNITLVKRGVPNKYLKLFKESTFENKNKYVFLGEQDDVVNPAIAVEKFTNVKVVTWLQENHKIKDFTSIAQLLNKVILDYKFRNINVDEKNNTEVGYKEIGNFVTKFYTKSINNDKTLYFVKSDIESYTDDEIIRLIKKHTDANNVILNKSDDNYVTAKY